VQKATSSSGTTAAPHRAQPTSIPNRNQRAMSASSSSPRRRSLHHSIEANKSRRPLMIPCIASTPCKTNVGITSHTKNAACELHSQKLVYVTTLLPPSDFVFGTRRDSSIPRQFAFSACRTLNMVHEEAIGTGTNHIVDYGLDGNTIHGKEEMNMRIE
jgi:hypothetical protein